MLSFIPHLSLVSDLDSFSVTSKIGRLLPGRGIPRQSVLKQINFHLVKVVRHIFNQHPHIINLVISNLPPSQEALACPSNLLTVEEETDVRF